MTGRPDTDRRIGAWLRELPEDVAPSSPAELAVARARHVRQRPVWLVALATPASVVLDDRGSRRRRQAVLVLVVVLLVASIVAALALSGAPKRDPRVAIVIPSPSSVVRSSDPRPTVTPFPTLHPTATPEPTPMTVHLVDLSPLGLQLTVRPGMSEPYVDTDTSVVSTTIAGFLWHQSLSVTAAARGDALTISTFGDTVVPCTDSATLRDRVAGDLDLPNKAAAIEIDGQHGWQLSAVRQEQRILVAGVATATRCIVATSVAPAAVPAFAEMPPQTDGGAVAFKRFLADLRLVDPNPTTPPPQLATPETGRFEIRCPGSWTVLQHVYQHAAPALTLTTGTPLSDASPLEVVTITSEADDGAIEIWDATLTTSRRIAVDTLGDLRQAVRNEDVFDTATDVDVDGVPGVLLNVNGVPTLLVVRDERAYVATVTALLLPGKPSILRTVVAGWRWTD